MKLNNLPFAKQHLLIVAFISFLSLFSYFFDTTLNEYFIYQRQLISEGQIWRLITGHIFHTNGIHLVLNISALWLLWSLHGHYYSIRNFSALLLVSALICSGGLYYFSPSLIQYVGLSGILHGVFIWGAVQDILNKEKTGYLLLMGVCLKIAHEQVYGASDEISALIEASVAIDAHLWGAIGGVAFSIFYFKIKGFKAFKP